MKVNIKIDITDFDRNLVANLIDEKETKRLVTRKELQKLVNGFVAGLTQHVYDSAPPVVVTPRTAFDPEKVPVQYRDKPIQWQIGWFRGRYLTKSFQA